MLFCLSHEEPLCMSCVLTHNRCTLIEIEEAPTRVDPDVRLLTLKSAIASLHKDIKFAKNIIETELLSISINTENCIAKMRIAVRRLNQNFEPRLVQILAEHQKKMIKCKSELIERGDIVEEIQSFCDKIESEHATEKLIATYQLEKWIQDNERNFSKLKKRKDITTINPMFCFEKIESVLLQLEKKSIGNKMEIVRLKKIKSFDIAPDRKPNFIRGCAILPNDEFCCTDDNERLVIITSTGLQRNLPLPCKPIDVKYAGGEKIAITLRENKSVAIFDRSLNEKSTLYLEEIKFKEIASIQGLACDGTHIFVCVGSYGVLKLDCLGNIRNKIRIQNEMNMQYVASCNDKLFYTKWDENKVYCSDQKGNVLWEFQDDIIKATTGIAADEHGNVYVTGSYSDNVIVISKDGLYGTEIIDHAENIHRPYAIDYSVSSKQLLVCSSSGHAVLYSVEKI